MSRFFIIGNNKPVDSKETRKKATLNEIQVLCTVKEGVCLSITRGIMAGMQPGTAEERRKCTSGRPNVPFNGPPGIASSSPFHPYRLRTKLFVARQRRPRLPPTTCSAQVICTRISNYKYWGIFQQDSSRGRRLKSIERQRYRPWASRSIKLMLVFYLSFFLICECLPCNHCYRRSTRR